MTRRAYAADARRASGIMGGMRHTPFALVLLVTASCAWVNKEDPPQTLTNKDYPCGVTGVVCVTQKMCCTEYHTCGGEPNSVGCGAGDCCYIGDATARKGDDWWHPVLKQTAQTH